MVVHQLVELVVAGSNPVGHPLMTHGISELVTLTPENTALIAIDMQADFYSPSGKAAKRGKLLTKMQRTAPLLDAFALQLSQVGILIIVTRFIAGKNITPQNLQTAINKEGFDFPCIMGSGGEELYNFTVPKNGILIDKPHYDAFSYTKLKNILKAHGIKNVLISGVRTEICVDITAKRAASEGFDTFILSDLVATYDDKSMLQENILDLFQKYYGFVVNSKEIVKYFQKI